MQRRPARGPDIDSGSSIRRAGWKQGFIRRLIPVGTAVNPFGSKGMLFDYHDPVAAPAGPPGARIARGLLAGAHGRARPPPGLLVRRLQPAADSATDCLGSAASASPATSPRCSASPPTPTSRPISRRGARRCARPSAASGAAWRRRERPSSGCTGRGRRGVLAWLPRLEEARRRRWKGGGLPPGCSRRWCAKGCRRGWCMRACSASTARDLAWDVELLPRAAPTTATSGPSTRRSGISPRQPPLLPAPRVADRGRRPQPRLHAGGARPTRPTGPTARR